MEEFKLAETEEDREKKIKKYKRKGLEEWQAEIFLDQRPKSFGLKNTFKTLTEEDSNYLELLSDKRDSLIKEYKKLVSEIQPLLKKLDPLLEKEKVVSEKLHQINQNICQIEGHRLSEKVEVSQDSDGYGGYLYYEYRTCLVCGERIYKEQLAEDDVVVKGKSDNPKKLTLK